MRLFALALAIAVATAGVWSASARESHNKSRWRMIGHDIRNSRSQPLEEEIGAKNVARLQTKWVFTTLGDVSATPAVSRGVATREDEDDDDREDDRGRGHRGEGRAVFFPDWGGMLWKLDAETGAVLWSNAMSTYNGIAGSISRTSPVLAHGMALTIANGVLYAGSMQHVGEQLYALDAATGTILWKFVAGGSVVSGPAVVDGTVYWGTGYARTGGVGNNKFYAFSIDGK
jgi:polyvinyl alcohol dehydrogenase (cytochrome)